MFHNVQAALLTIQRQLAQVLEPRQILDACREAGHTFRRRVLDPVATIHLFLLQILKGNVAIERLRDCTDLAFSAGSYCKARMRLPLRVLQTLLAKVGTAVRDSLGQAERWHGHRTFHVDGSSFSMPDTPELQEHFGQPGAQKPGCGFPVAHLLALFHAGTGFLLKVLASPLRTHDLSEASLLHPELEEGDVLIGDRAFCSYAHLALLRQRGLHGVFRAHQRLIVDFRPGRPHNRPGRKPRKGRPWSCWIRSLGKHDQRVVAFKPTQRPSWISAEDYAALPDTLALRELRYRLPRGVGRTREVTLVTTLLDPECYPAADLAALYGQRWQVETNLRHLKQTMGLDVLHCEDVAGVLKELTMFALAYNLVRAVMVAAAERQKVAVDRISFADALG